METFAPSFSGTIAACHATPSSKVIQSGGGNALLTVTCYASATGGKGDVTITSDGVNFLTATLTVTVNAIDVTPDTTLFVVPGTVGSQLFKVKNLGSTGVPTQVGFKTTCAGCTVTPASPITINARDSATITVNYQVDTSKAGSSLAVILRDSLVAQPTSLDLGTVTVIVPPPLAPSVSLAPHNGDNRARGLCVAACFDVAVAYSTPSYRSLDADRSATLVYTSDQAKPFPIVQVDVIDSSRFKAQKFSLQDRHRGALATFTNGMSQLFTKQSAGGATTRLAGQFDGSADGTGVYVDTAIVTSRWDSGAYATQTKQTTVPLTVLVMNERSSPFGAGWSLAGLARLYFSSDSLTLALTDGAGSIARFTRSCKTCQASAAAADFTVINTIQDAVTHAVLRYEARGRDGSAAAFNGTGLLTFVANRFVDTTKFSYDGSSRIQVITDPAGKTLTFAYANGKLSSITDPGGRVSQFVVNASGDLQSITDPTGTVTFVGTYDAQHLLTQRTDRAGNSWKHVYDFAGKSLADSTPPLLADMTITGTGSLTTQRLGSRMRSSAASVLIDPASGLGGVTNAAPQRISASVRAAQFTVTGDSVTYQLDRFLAVTRVEQISQKDTTIFTRDSDERVTKMQEFRRGIVVASTARGYNGPRVVADTDFVSGTRIAYTYDTTFDLVTKVSGTTTTVRNYLNLAKNWIDSSRVGSSPDSTKDTVVVFTHDVRARVTKVLSPSKDTAFTYYGSSGFQNLDSVRSGTRRTKYRYDSWGRVIRVIDPRRDSVRMVMDALNRIDTVIAPGAKRTAYAYDSLGNVRLLTDAKGQAYKAHFNAVGWVDTTVDAVATKADADRRDVFEFTLTGATRAHIDRNHRRTSLIFDHRGRDSVRTLADGRSTTFTHDTLGYWMAASNAESSDTTRTDQTGNPHFDISVRGGVKYMTYARSDVYGVPRSNYFIVGPDTVQKITYGYGYRLTLDTITVGGRNTVFSYNGSDALVGMKHTRGLNNTTIIDNVAYSLTAMQQRYLVAHSAPGLAGFREAYTRDSLERITRRTNAAGDTAWTFAYDSVGELVNHQTNYYSGGETCVPDPFFMDGQHCTPNSTPTTVQNTNFTFDSAGNRSDGNPTLIGGNRLTSWQGFTLAYDSAGNLVHKQQGSFDQYLYWNSIGQLDSVKTNGAVVSFGYDGIGRRVRKTVGPLTWRYYYGGSQIMAMDSAGIRVRIFTYYPGADQPHSVVLNSGERFYFIQESGAGSIWGLMDSTGAVRNRFRYAPFGTLIDSVETIRMPFRFTGQEYDAETRLYYYRARYYDPVLARFISEDPKGLAGGVNQYAYVGGDPVNQRDPSGMDPESMNQMTKCSWAFFRCQPNPMGFGTTWNGGFSWGDWQNAIDQNVATAADMAKWRAWNSAQAIGRAEGASFSLPAAVGMLPISGAITGTIFYAGWNESQTLVVGGFERAGGVWVSSGGVAGFFVTVGGGWGYSYGGAAMVGYSTNFAAFTGQSTERCAGIGGYVGCYSWNDSGFGESFLWGLTGRGWPFALTQFQTYTYAIPLVRAAHWCSPDRPGC